MPSTTKPDTLLEPLWPDGAPAALGTAPEDIPAITLYQATKSDGSTIIVCPGGGYQGLWPPEGEPIARWLNTLGINAFVLRYRLAPRYHHPIMMHDVTRAVRVVRFHAKNHGFDEKRIGVMGFSAGGHLAGTACTLFDDGTPDAKDPIDRVSSRPDVGILVYPVITMRDPAAHAGSRANLLGEHPSKELVDELSLETRVTKRTPPVFLFHTMDDDVVPVANSLLFATAMRTAGVPCELHCYEHGQHGVNLATDMPQVKSWPGLCATWLNGKNFGTGI